MFKHKKNEDLVNQQISDIFFKAGTANEEQALRASDSSLSSSSQQRSHILFFAVLALCCCFVVTVVVISHFSHQKKKNRAFSEKVHVLNGLMDATDPVSDYLGLQTLGREVMSGSARMTGNLSMENLKDAGSDVAGLTLDFDLKHAAINRQLGLDLTIKYRGANALSAKMYADNTALLFKIPSKSEKIFSLNYNKAENLLQEKTTSPYLKQLLSENILYNLSGDWTDYYGGTDIISLYYDTIKNAYPKDYQKILNSITATPAEPDSFGNACTIYTMSEEGFETLVKCILTATLENEHLYRIFYPTVLYVLNHHLLTLQDDDTQANTSTAFDDILFNLQSAASAFAMSHTGDFHFTVWQNGQGFITGILCDNDIKISEQILSLQMQMETENDPSPFDHAHCTLQLGYDTALLNMVFERTCEDDVVKKVNNHFYCDINGESAIEINHLAELDSEDHSFTYRFSLVTPDEADSFLVACEGTFENIIKENAFDLNIQKLYINDGFSNLMTLSGTLSVKAEKQKINKLTGSHYELTDMSDDELKKLFGIGDR